MATVPLQTTPTEEYEVGSAVQFSGTQVEPVRDTVGDDGRRMSQALRNVSQTAFAIQDERDDAESKRLANELSIDVKASQDRYQNLKGAAALETVERDGKKITQLDVVNNEELKNILEKYRAKASNGKVRYMFDRTASVYIKTAQENNITHSLEQLQIEKQNETNASIHNNKNWAKLSYKDWADPAGNFKKFYTAGLIHLEEKARQNNWSTEIRADGSYVSSQFQKEVELYNLEISKDVVKKLAEDNDPSYKKFILPVISLLGEEEGNKLKEEADGKVMRFGVDRRAKALFADNGNQNNGDFMTIVTGLLTLSSNNSFDDGKDAVVIDGLHSDEYELTNRKTTENIERLEKQRNESKFFNPESKTRLIPQHQPTHLFAIQVLDVKKADSLYTKAKSSLDIDPQRFKDDPKYAKAMNAKIIDKYNDLIIANANRKYFLTDGTYVNKVKNDLEVIKKKIDYDYDPSKETIKVDFKSGMQAYEVLKEKFKDTTKDSKELEYGLKHLEIEYNKRKDAAEGFYNEVFDKALDVSFAAPGGWENLAEYDIDITEFTKEDQEKLKNGPPKESNIETLAVLADNPKKVRDNLNAHRHQLSSLHYAELRRYGDSLASSETKVIAAEGDNTLLKDVMFKRGYEWVYKDKFGGNSSDFYAIRREWIDRIDYAQKTTDKKIDRAEKTRLLENVILDKVNVKNKERNVFASTIPDQMEHRVWVQVGKERIFSRKIDKDVRAALLDSLFKQKLPMSEQKVAEEWVKFGKPDTYEAAKKAIEKLLSR